MGTGVGATVGVGVGLIVGDTEGCEVGDRLVGAAVGASVGIFVGADVGASVKPKRGQPPSMAHLAQASTSMNSPVPAGLRIHHFTVERWITSRQQVSRASGHTVHMAEAHTTGPVGALVGEVEGAAVGAVGERVGARVGARVGH